MRRLLLYLPIVCCSVGCASWKKNTIAPNELPAVVQAQAPAKLKTLQLATLGSPVQPEYRIEPGDLLEVTISDLVGENQFSPLPLRVLEDGTIRLPLAGPVAVSGLSFPEAEQIIFATYSSQGLLKKPLVTVALRDTRKFRIYVLGAVNKPGQYDLHANESDLLSALVAAGGLTNDAGTVIEIRRRVQTGATLARRESKSREVRTAGSPGTSSNGNPSAGAGQITPAKLSFQDTDSGPALGSSKQPQPAVAHKRYNQYDPCGLESNDPGLQADALAKSPPPAEVRRAQHTTTTPAPEVRHAQYTTTTPAPEVRRAQHTTAGPAAPATGIFRLDLTNEAAKAKLTQGFHLQNGDTITIEDRKTKPIYVVGMVNKPGEFPLPVDRDIRVLEAIGLAGGVDRNSLPDKALIVRQRPDGGGVVTVRIDLDKAKRDNAENIRIMAGDTVSVEETVASYMRGLLRGAVRFGVGASVSPVYGF